MAKAQTKRNHINERIIGISAAAMAKINIRRINRHQRKQSSAWLKNRRNNRMKKVAANENNEMINARTQSCLSRQWLIENES